jgi:hypothetical protein
MSYVKHHRVREGIEGTIINDSDDSDFDIQIYNTNNRHKKNKSNNNIINDIDIYEDIMNPNRCN